MKNCLLLLICSCILSAALAQSTLRVDSMYSNALGKYEKYQIYLPDGYARDTAKRYPVVYFLHGALSNHTGYAFIKGILDTLISKRTIQPMIVVKPNGSQGNFGGSMYFNSTLYGRVEDFIVKDLVPYIDQNYRTLGTRNTRVVMGHSMGGDGAARFGIAYPDVFCGFAAHSGSLDFSFVTLFFQAVVGEQIAQNDSIPYQYLPTDGFATAALFRVAGAASPNLSRPPYYVDYPLDSLGNPIDSVLRKWRALDAAFIVMANPPKQKIGIFFDCGEQDEFGFLVFNHGFRDSLSRAGLSYVYQNFTGGHQNKLLERLPVSLVWLDSLMSALVTPVSTFSSLQEQVALSIYPNPASTQITVDLSTPENVRGDVLLQNAAGQIVRVLQKDWAFQASATNRMEISLSGLPAGTYWIVVKGKEFVISKPVQRVE